MSRKKEVVDALTAAEAKAFTNAEAIIRKSLSSFIEVGNALREIREGRLYRAMFPTFEEYCQDRWSIGRNYANKQIASAELVKRIGYNVYPPQNESQCRALLEAGDAAEKVWKEVLKRSPTMANDEPCITAKLIAAVRDELVTPKPKRPKKQKSTTRPETNGHASTPPTVPEPPEDDQPFEEPPLQREPGEDDGDDELDDSIAKIEQWDGAKINQLLKVITYYENKLIAAEATLNLRIVRLFPHHGLPLKRWDDELTSKTRDLKRFRQKLETAKADAKARASA